MPFHLMSRLTNNLILDNSHNPSMFQAPLHTYINPTHRHYRIPRSAASKASHVNHLRPGWTMQAILQVSYIKKGTGLMSFSKVLVTLYLSANLQQCAFHLISQAIHADRYKIRLLLSFASSCWDTIRQAWY